MSARKETRCLLSVALQWTEVDHFGSSIRAVLSPPHIAAGTVRTFLDEEQVGVESDLSLHLVSHRYEALMLVFKLMSRQMT